ncbi:hypothetical protein [Bradyrhizobium sp. USDA 4452]
MSRRTVSIDQLDNLSVDELDQLYWKGRRIAAVVDLPWWIRFSAVATGLGASAAGIVSVILLAHILLGLSAGR